jgi:AraC family transcriptional regulator
MSLTTAVLEKSWNIQATNSVIVDGFDDVAVAHWTHQEAELPEAISDTHALIVPQKPFDCTQHLGRKSTRLIGGIGDVGFVPAGSVGTWQFQTPIDVVHIYLAPDMLERAAQETGLSRHGLGSMPLQSKLSDALVGALGCEVARAVGPEPPPRLYIDHMSRALALRLVSLHNHVPESRPARGGLAPWQVRRVQEFIASNLARDVSLSEIAHVSGLSQFHFARAFKKSVGVPPYVYQRRCRIERACSLLADRALSVLDVALSVGFESPQAFARAFRRETGCSPTEYRSAVLGVRPLRLRATR